VRVDEETIDLAGTPIHLRRAGTAEVPVLYLHGIPTSSVDFVPWLERTGGLAPDLIGFGRSAKGGNLDYTLEGQLGELEALLDALDVENCRLVAHDWGAVPALMLAQQTPWRFERIALINAIPLLPGFHWHRLARLWRRPIVGELTMGSTTKHLLARTLRRACVRPDAFPPARVDEIWEQFDQGTQRALLRMHRDGSETRLAEAGAGLGEINRPALVVWGEADPWLAGEFGRAYAERLGARLQSVPDAGHWPWLDRPELIEQVADFVST
jgi:pimeloyl-ACP methyl ester carboxylesterase